MRWHLNHKAHGKKPWPVQKAAGTSQRKSGRERYGYFLEQGLGKTPLSLNDYVDDLWSDKVDGCVVISPQSFKGDWALAPGEWGVGEHILSGSWPKFTPEQCLRPGNHSGFLLSMNYEATRGRGGQALYDLLRKRRVSLIVDESSAIKNPKSQQARSILDLAKDAASVRELNGTPQVQNVMDWFPQLKLLGELDGKNPYAFRNRYAVMGGYMGKVVQRNQIRNEEELFALIDACAFRALKSDWRKDLPDRLFPPLHLEMSNKQRAHYREMMEEFYTCVNGDDVSAELVLTQYEKLRQISSCLAMTEDGFHWIEEPKNNPKVRALYDVMDSGPGKTIVVHFYKPTGVMLMEELEKAGLQPAMIRGGMSENAITEEKARFNSDPDCRVIVCQQVSAHLGHTLIGQKRDRATRMYFFENSFRLVHRLQMLDRNHRGEMDETCLVFDPITSPMDQLIIDNLKEKKDMADYVDATIATVRAEFEAMHGRL